MDAHRQKRHRLFLFALLLLQFLSHYTRTTLPWRLEKRVRCIRKPSWLLFIETAAYVTYRAPTYFRCIIITRHKYIIMQILLYPR